MKKHLARALHLATGTHSFGNATTIICKPGKSFMEILDHGVLYINTEAKKRIFVPWANIKTMDLDPASTWPENESLELKKK